MDDPIYKTLLLSNAIISPITQSETSHSFPHRQRLEGKRGFGICVIQFKNTITYLFSL